MREILFKAKRIDTGEWVEGYIFDDGNVNPEHYFVGTLCISRYKGTADDKWDIDGECIYEVHPDTICQFTGRVDKNGQKIWENDILVAHLDEKFKEDETYEQVIWHESGFCTMEKNSTDFPPLDDFDTRYFAVCGNVFDNAELLERKE